MSSRLTFRGGTVGALAPFVVFLGGVAALGLAGAPDERGFWPVLVGAISIGMLLVTDRRAYAEAIVAGMSQSIVALMILAWLLAGMLAAVLQASGFVEGLAWLGRSAGLGGGGYAVTAFLIASVVSTATGTSLGTLVLCAPLLYPAGAEMGATPAVLMGAILGGATFGDNVSPVSDTTIASATTQGADMGGVVRSRLRYAMPAAVVAALGYAVLGGRSVAAVRELPPVPFDPWSLLLLLSPLVVLGLLLAGRHLLEGLLAGIAVAIGVALVSGRVTASALLYIDAERFGARGLLVEGLERGVGVSIFTLLLMGLAGGLEASGLVDRLVSRAERRSRSPRSAEAWLFVAASGAVLLTTHSVVALLTVGRFGRQVGERFGIGPYRRANLLDLTVCTYPFILPFFIPTVLAASTTASGVDAGMPRLSPQGAGLWNLHSWALLVVVVIAIATGWGRDRRASRSGKRNRRIARKTPPRSG